MATTISAALYHTVAGAASTDPHRPHLNGVWIEPHPSNQGALLVATDGHILAVAYDPAAVVAKPVLLTSARALIKAARAKKADRITVASEATVITSNGTALHIQPNALIDATFPDWRRVVTPIKPTGPATGVFALGVTERVVSIARAASVPLGDTKDPVLVLLVWSQSGPEEPALVRIASINNVFMVAMPARPANAGVVDSDRAFPGWL